MSNFKIFNGFGIKPTKSYSAAGWDFYIPNIDGQDVKKVEMAYEALKKSYKKTDGEINTILSRLQNEVSLIGKSDLWDKQYINILHLFLSIDGAIMRTSQNKVNTFAHYYLVFNEAGIPGIKLHCNDHVLINSGIKVSLDTGTAGVFLNKSGKGNKGFDTRAQVVDEDYTGYVHLSQAYTKDNTQDGYIYCGDKLTQMLILPLVVKDECEELDESTYNTIMADSQRGSDGFGSTDNKK